MFWTGLVVGLFIGQALVFPFSWAIYVRWQRQVRELRDKIERRESLIDAQEQMLARPVMRGRVS